MPNSAAWRTLAFRSLPGSEPAMSQLAPGPSRVGLVEKGSMMLILSVYAAALVPALRRWSSAGTIAVGDSDPTVATVQYAALLIVSIWFFVRRDVVFQYLKHNWLYVSIIILSGISVLWSRYPYISLRRTVTLGVCVGYGLYLYDRIGLEGLLRLYIRTAVLLAIMSLAVYYGAPEIGRDSGEGYSNALRGVFAAKNAAGMMMTIAITCTLYIGSRPGNSKIIAGFEYILLFITLIYTRSATSTVIGLILTFCSARLWIRKGPARLIYQYIIFSIVVIMIYVVVFLPDQIFPMLGRDASFTGRMPLWEESLGLIAQAPVLGYGYSGFWNVDSKDVQYLWAVIGWEAPNAHDGYLDILLQLGIVGLVLYLSLWGTIIVRAFTRLRAGDMPEAAWILIMMLGNVILNIDEGPLPYADEFTLLLPGCLIMLARAKARDQERSYRERVASKPFFKRSVRLAARAPIVEVHAAAANPSVTT